MITTKKEVTIKNGTETIMEVSISEDTIQDYFAIDAMDDLGEYKKLILEEVSTKIDEIILIIKNNDK